MKTDVYLKQELKTKLFALIKGDECNYCNGTYNLELFHNVTFGDILMDTLSDLGLDYLPNKHDYSKYELQLIKQLMIGKYCCYDRNRTLCENCRLEIELEKEYIKKKILSELQ